MGKKHTRGDGEKEEKLLHSTGVQNGEKLDGQKKTKREAQWAAGERYT